MKKCACADDDAQRCHELCTYGYSPATQNEDEEQKCDCPCHDKRDEDEEGE